MANPLIKIDVNASGASDVNASGAGPAGPALQGAAGQTASDGSSNVGCRVTLNGSPDLSNVATDGSHAIFWNDSTAGTRNFAMVVAKGNSGTPSAFVDVPSSQFLGGTTPANGVIKGWAIGGTRLTIGGTQSKKLLDNNVAAGDAMGGWILEMQSGHAETLTATLSMRRSGDIGNGPVMLRGAPGAAVRPMLTWNLNSAMIAMSVANVAIADFDLQNSNATKTASIAISGQLNCRVQRMRVVGAGAMACWKAFSVAANGCLVDSCEFANCVADAITSTAAGRFKNNYLHDNGGNAFAFTGGNAGGLVQDNLCVRNANGIADSRTGIIQQGGYYIVGNTFHGHVGNGMNITSDGSTNQTPYINLFVEDNNFTANGSWGINLFGGSLNPMVLEFFQDIFRGNNFGAGSSANAAGTCSVAAAIADPTNVQVDPGYVNPIAGVDNFTVANPAAQGIGFPTSNIGNGWSGTRSYTTSGVAQAQAGGGGGFLVYGGLVR